MSSARRCLWCSSPTYTAHQNVSWRDPDKHQPKASFIDLSCHKQTVYPPQPFHIESYSIGHMCLCCRGGPKLQFVGSYVKIS